MLADFHADYSVFKLPLYGRGGTAVTYTQGPIDPAQSRGPVLGHMQTDESS